MYENVHLCKFVSVYQVFAHLATLLYFIHAILSAIRWKNFWRMMLILLCGSTQSAQIHYEWFKLHFGTFKVEWAETLRSNEELWNTDATLCALMKRNTGRFTSHFCDLTAQCVLTFTPKHCEPMAKYYIREYVILTLLQHLCFSAEMTRYFSIDNCLVCL